MLIAVMCVTAGQAQPIVAGFERMISRGDADQIEAGKLLIGELQCASCHAAGEQFSAHIFQKPAPVLDKAGERIRLDYLKEFLAGPHQTKPGTTMPDLLAGLSAKDRNNAAEALAHFIASRGGPFKSDTEPASGEDIQRGEKLFHTVGCVACHQPFAPPPAHQDGEEPAVAATAPPPLTIASVPLGNLAQKTSVEALAQFLLNRLVTRPGARMPQVRLTEMEANAIAAYLIHRGTEPAKTEKSAPRPSAEKARRGEALFAELGCASCHSTGPKKTPSRAVTLPLSELHTSGERGCLAKAPQRGAPHFALSDAQREALLAALSFIHKSNEPPGPEAKARQMFSALNCFACHERRGFGGPEIGRAAYFVSVQEMDLGDEGRLPPALSGAGRKLLPEWLEQVITGSEGVRPYLATRMPGFGEAHGKALAGLLVEADKDIPALPMDVTGGMPHHRAHYGRELLGINGLGCINCHVIRGHRSLGIPAVDLATVTQRLQPAWFKEFLLNPAAMRPQTRMPAFFSEGKSAAKLFGGDAGRQIEAIWTYLKEVDQARLPEGMEKEGTYELVPTNQPIILRTFLHGAGTHAIGVGFPQGTHFAFDGLEARLALVWRGRFLDAESTWADRFAAMGGPLGTNVLSLKELTPVGPSKNAMRGYRLDARGVPEFLYEMAGVAVKDRIEPMENEPGWLRRTRTFSGLGEPLALTVATAKTITAGSGDVFVIGDQMRVLFPEQSKLKPAVQSRGETAELVVTLQPVNGEATLLEEFTW